ncbi:tetratricopeptide repeat protein [Ignatzschineria sp. LJL83]
MNRYPLQRLMRMITVARYYVLVALFIYLSLIIATIARATQIQQEKRAFIISSVIASQKELLFSPVLVLESVAESDLIAQQHSKAEAISPIQIELISRPTPTLIGAISTELISKVQQIQQQALYDLQAQKIENDIDLVMSQISPAAIEHHLNAIEEDEVNNYVLFTLFPHKKNAIIEEPVVKPYPQDAHVEELSIIKLANKIDNSLSISEDEDLFEDWEASEAYYDDLQDYEYAESSIDIVFNNSEQDSESSSYPYLQGPDEILEAESAFIDFISQPMAQQIEQSLKTGDYYLFSDNPIKARQHYVHAVKLGANNKTSPLYAKALVKLADMEDNFYLARFQYTNALEIYESHRGYDAEVADILVKLVWTFDMATERIVIYELLTRAKQIQEKHDYTPQYTEVLRNLAIYYEIVDDFEKADAHYKAALALDLQHLTSSDIRTILALENYATFYLKFGEYRKAEEILLFKLDTHEAISPPDYYNLGRTESMLGWTYLQLDELSEALTQYNSALRNINYSISKNQSIPHYYSLPAIFDLVHIFVYLEDFPLAITYYDLAESLLINEQETDLLEYIQNTDLEEIDFDNIVNYHWAAETEVLGLKSILDYLQENPQP